MEEKYKRATFRLPLILSLAPVLMALYFLAMTFMNWFVMDLLRQLLQRFTTNMPHSQLTQAATAIYTWLCISAASLPVILFPAALVLSLRHYRRTEEEEGRLYRRLPLITILCTFLPTLLFFVVGIGMFLSGRFR